MCHLFILNDCLPNTPIPNCNQDCCEENGKFQFFPQIINKKYSNYVPKLIINVMFYNEYQFIMYLIQLICVGCEVCTSRRVSLFGTFWICEGFDIECCINERKIEV